MIIHEIIEQLKLVSDKKYIVKGFICELNQEYFVYILGRYDTNIPVVYLTDENELPNVKTTDIIINEFYTFCESEYTNENSKIFLETTLIINKNEYESRFYSLDNAYIKDNIFCLESTTPENLLMRKKYMEYK